MFIGAIEDIPNLEYINCCTLCAEPFLDPAQDDPACEEIFHAWKSFPVKSQRTSERSETACELSLLFPLCSNGLIKYKKITDSRHRSQSKHASYHPVQSAR